MAEIGPEIDHVAVKAAVKEVLASSGVGKHGFEEYSGWGSRIVFGGLGAGFEEPIAKGRAFGVSAGHTNGQFFKQNAFVPHTHGDAGHDGPGGSAGAGSETRRGGKKGTRGQHPAILLRQCAENARIEVPPPITCFGCARLHPVSNAVRRAT